VKEALVFGVNRSMLGVVIIPSQNGTTPQSHTASIRDANIAAPSHAQIAPELVVVLSPNQSFPKASKGTLQRGKAYDAYSSVIDGAYQLYESSGETEKSGKSGKLKLSEGQLLEYIVETIAQVMQLDKTDIEADDDLFNLGLNSVQALRVRNLLKTVSANSEFLMRYDTTLIT
jgi:aryl carrier-like protein